MEIYAICFVTCYIELAEYCGNKKGYSNFME